MENRKVRLVNFRKPKINTSVNDLPSMTKTAWDALRRRNNPPYLFSYGGSPHRLEADDSSEKTLIVLDVYRLRHEVARAAYWVKIGMKGMEFPTPPPLDVIRDMLAEPDIPLPGLMRLSQIPVFSSNGTLVSEPGYHQPTRTYLALPPNLEIPTVPRVPTDEDISRAKSFILEELLIDFPFVSESDRTGYMQWPCSCSRLHGLSSAVSLHFISLSHRHRGLERPSL